MSKTALTAEQKALQEDAAQYATKYLAKATSIHSTTVWPRHTHQRERHELTRPLYRTAVQYGLVKFQIPQQLGGSGLSAADAGVAFEETYAADASVTLSLAATGLGLLPLILAGTPAQHKRFLQPFLAGKGEPVASLMFSEPGGAAGWLDGKGLQTTAHREGNYWVVNGAKEGNLNSAGWDRQGADLNVLVCRAVGPAYTNVSASPREAVVVLLVPRALVAAQQQQQQRGRPAWQVLSEAERPAQPAVSGPHVRLRGFRVPADGDGNDDDGNGSHVLAGPEQGAQLVRRCLAREAAVAGACAVGVMRAAVEAAERAARRRGESAKGLEEPLVALGAVRRSLAEMRERVEAGRALVRRALRQLDGDGDVVEVEAASREAMMQCQDAAVRTVTDAMRIVGPLAARAEQPFGRWLATAASLPLTDSGVWTLEGERAVSGSDELVDGTRSLAL